MHPPNLCWDIHVLNYQIGRFDSYQEGGHTLPDMNKALLYYNLAAQQKHPGALWNLGLFYKNGTNCEKDTLRAAKYLEDNLKEGLKVDPFPLAEIYLNAEDFQKAIHYLKISFRDYGILFSGQKLIEIYEKQNEIGLAIDLCNEMKDDYQRKELMKRHMDYVDKENRFGRQSTIALFLNPFPIDLLKIINEYVSF